MPVVEFIFPCSVTKNNQQSPETTLLLYVHNGNGDLGPTEIGRSYLFPEEYGDLEENREKSKLRKKLSQGVKSKIIFCC